MAEYIDREKAQKYLLTYQNDGYSYEPSYFASALEKLPTADVIEREKIDKAREEIENIGMGSYLEFIKEIECNNREVRLSKKFAIAILDKLIAESEK